MYYINPEIEAGTGTDLETSAFFSAGYDTCGARIHYLVDFDPDVFAAGDPEYYSSPQLFSNT